VLLLIDNYDSFTYNLLHYFAILGQNVVVVRNDQLTVAQVEAMLPDCICLSPGPGGPEEAGITVEVVRRLAGKVPMLGVCLGHQSIAYAFGARIVGAPSVMHGKVSAIRHSGGGLHRSLPQGFRATRYHSLAVYEPSLPSNFHRTAWAEEDGCLMGFEDPISRLYAVQYHPEAILTEHGMDLLYNYLRCAQGEPTQAY
jgi:anthranilate synthase component II